jgi:hypothetical protein
VRRLWPLRLRLLSHLMLLWQQPPLVLVLVPLVLSLPLV